MRDFWGRGILETAWGKQRVDWIINSLLVGSALIFVFAIRMITPAQIVQPKAVSQSFTHNRIPDVKHAKFEEIATIDTGSSPVQQVSSPADTAGVAPSASQSPVSNKASVAADIGGANLPVPRALKAQPVGVSVTIPLLGLSAELKL